jgi:HprK-related kinase A
MHSLTVTVGPRAFRIGSTWRAPLAQLAALYADYPQPADSIAHYRIRLDAPRWVRRHLRPQVAIQGDYTLPEAVPLPYSQAILAAEMGMNLQIALGERRLMLLHAASVEKAGKVVILTGESGSGKSTLAAMLGEAGWRLMGDEFALIDPETGQAFPFPRPVSLKNEAIAAMQALAGEERFGPLLKDTPKGDIRHFRPSADAVARMAEPGTPTLILFPRFGANWAIRPVGQGEAFVRLTQASTNYTMLGERGFSALTRLVQSVPAKAIDYMSGAEGISIVESLFEGAGA